jgi:hypothetical protein
VGGPESGAALGISKRETAGTEESVIFARIQYGARNLSALTDVRTVAQLVWFERSTGGIAAQLFLVNWSLAQSSSCKMRL